MYFDFETDFIETMRCIPMAVRCKLDMCGIKLKLAEWSRFSKEERDQLAEMVCESEEEIAAYRQLIQNLVWQHTQAFPDDCVVETHPAWLNASEIPESLLEKSKLLGVQISLKQWTKLTVLQRFALVKLSRPSHESKNFPPCFAGIWVSVKQRF